MASSSTAPAKSRPVPTTRVAGVRHASCSLQIGNFLAMGTTVNAFLRASKTKGFVPEVLVVAPLQVVDNSGAINRLAVPTVMKLAGPGPTPGEIIITRSDGQTSWSYRASLYWIERRTRPTRASSQYALYPHVQWRAIAATPERKLEGVHNFAACGMTLNQYFTQFQALKFEAWVVAATSFDVLNGEGHSINLAAGTFVHLGDLREDTAVILIAIKGVGGRFLTDAVSLQIYTRPTDEILALLQAKQTKDNEPIPTQAPLAPPQALPQAASTPDQRRDASRPSRLIMTCTLRARDMMGRQAELAQNSVVGYLSSSDLPGWCVLTKDQDVLVPVRNEDLSRVAVRPEEAAFEYPPSTIDFAFDDITTSVRVYAEQDTTCCDSFGDAMLIRVGDIITQFCRGATTLRWFFTSMGRIGVMDLRRDVRLRRVRENAGAQAVADDTNAEPASASGAMAPTRVPPGQAIANSALLHGRGSSKRAAPTEEPPDMAFTPGTTIDLTEEEDLTEDSPSNFASAGLSPSPERKEHGLLQRLFAPRSPPISITQRQVRASNWQLKHSRAIDTSGAHIDLRAIFTGEMWEKDEAKHTPALESISTAEPTPSFEPPSMFDW
ncbi:hypothetical protein TI39_contig4129g00004 [Zymoseptoria brevis]|uniref:Uncharacterized protein n=1 Tax=Zymoseptoria brevis TaxID=1047168 RepID=A0A0F4GCW7_9PEZI|nr:hypothetical protein TI39_contig4129g00004 [Zymoseptoria brevis]